MSTSTMGADVTEPHEPSYYEIALTNRQVLVAFVILLVCLLAAFLSGVWVGRGGATAQAGAGPPPPAPVADAGAEKPLAEYRFFSEEGKRPAAPPASPPAPPLEPAPGPGSTLLDDVRGPQVAGGAERPAGQPPAAAPGDEEPGAPRAAAEPVENAPAVPAPPLAAAVEASENEMVIQVFSSPDEPQAKRILTQLTAAGFKAFVSPVRVGDQTMHRVRIGPFTDRAEAQRIAGQVKQQFRLDTWITR